VGSGSVLPIRSLGDPGEYAGFTSSLGLTSTFSSGFLANKILKLCVVSGRFMKLAVNLKLNV
jgi:hypothetical protein